MLEWTPPHARWFVGGTTNISYNCLDRHLQGPRRNKAALIWEGENGDIRTLTYLQLHREVCKMANCLKELGVTKGDRVAIYMPLLLETAVSMLACARIGAIHNVVFGGFSPDALADRINDSGCKVLITADGGWRRGTVVPLKHNADRALESCPTVEHVIIVKQLPAVPLDSEDTLFILYTSGTTGKPKGIVHAAGGYAVGVHTTARTVFDLRDEDTFWCTADVGWVTGHSYVVYGPLLAGATVLLYEGAPDFPEKDRYWEMIARHRVSVFYTAPTAIRSFMKWGDELPARHDLSSLRLLGTVGEPINPEAWMWYHTHIGRAHCPIVDTWWQTETGAIMISGLPGVSTMKPGFAGTPASGHFGDRARRVRQGGEGRKRPPGDHPAVAEAAVVGRHHDIKGQAIVAFVSLKNGHTPSSSMGEDLKQHVVKKIGALARPEEILFTRDLPKTRSGKIMRRLLRDIAEGRALGDVTTLADPAVVVALREDYEEKYGG